jgi:hypothetical protein
MVNKILDPFLVHLEFQMGNILALSTFQLGEISHLLIYYLVAIGLCVFKRGTHISISYISHI